MGFVDVTEYLALPRAEKTWVLEGILPTSGLLNIYGQAKTHKSILALQISEAIGNPDIPEVLGFPVHQHGRVAYLQIDTPRVLWADRILKFFPDIRATSFSDKEDPDLPYPFDVLSNGLRFLREEMAKLKPLVVIIDTIREAHMGDENTSDHMQLVVNTLQAAVQPAACIMISHSRKNPSEGGFNLMSDNRGSSYVGGRCDCVMHIGFTKVTYNGRAIAEASDDITRDPRNHHIKLKEPGKVIPERLLRAHPEWTEAQQTTEVERVMQISRDAARGLVRRAIERLTKPVQTDSSQS